MKPPIKLATAATRLSQRREITGARPPVRSMYTAYAMMKMPKARDSGLGSTLASNQMPINTPLSANGMMRLISRHSTLRHSLTPCDKPEMIFNADDTGTTICNGAASASTGTATTPPPNPAPLRTANASITPKAKMQFSRTPKSSITPLASRNGVITAAAQTPRPPRR